MAPPEAPPAARRGSRCAPGVVRIHARLSRWAHLSLAGAALSVSCAGPASAQDTTHHVWGFVNTKADTRRADHIYTGYGYDRVFVITGLVDNPRSGYTEELVGVGVRGSLASRGTHAALLAFCSATDGRYAQLYYIPSVTTGRITTGGMLEAYLPLERSATPQVSLGSVAVTTEIRPALAIGPMFELDLARNVTPQAGLGATLRATSGAATVGVDLVQQWPQRHRHAALSFRVTF